MENINKFTKASIEQIFAPFFLICPLMETSLILNLIIRLWMNDVCKFENFLPEFTVIITWPLMKFFVCLCEKQKFGKIN